MKEAKRKCSGKITVPAFLEKKKRGETITMLTAYDYASAFALDKAGIDSILVGDSLGMVVLGYETTLPVTMADMIHHCKAVSRGARRPLLVGDMPFMSYQASKSEAVRNAGRFLQEAGMDAVKLEGGRERLGTVQAIVEAGIPVMGHLGLTPQSVRILGGFSPQATSVEDALTLIREARLLQDAGCFSLVLENVPAQVAEWVAGDLTIPVIGIGAGTGCDGQVLVLHDMLGMFDRFLPRFVKQYAGIGPAIQDAVQVYMDEVAGGVFPAGEHQFSMDEKEWRNFLDQVPAE